ncbi:MAG: hypothetical protein NC924_02680 [Candidatus Omnitrophica bacterium]|nr:hypothetical protein [Candidatus Omnitrophota bacterium]
MKKGILVVAAIAVLFGCMPRKMPHVEKPWVRIEKTAAGHFQMFVADKPFTVQGVCYAPIPIGKSHLFNFPSDPAKPWMVDGPLMQAMGVNTIRLYTPGDDWPACRAMIEELYAQWGIRTIMGHSLGFWDYPPANYAEEEFLVKVTEDVLHMVDFFKDSPAILFWNLGNENNYSFDGRVNPWSTPEIDALPTFGEQSDERARLYYSFINALTKKIKAADPNHPVSLGNGETVGLKSAAEYCPDVDMIGAIVYRGKVFGNFFKEIKRKFDKPVVLTEFGCDAFNAVTQKEDQNNQAIYLKSQWLDLETHLAGGTGEGNCLGGVIFEWTDEWWKTSDSNRDSWLVHDTEAGWGVGAFAFDAKAGKNMNEEWFGIVAIAPELEQGVNKRMPRKAYYVLQRLWTIDKAARAEEEKAADRRPLRGQKIQ